jgi:uncharacterized membrane protein
MNREKQLESLLSIIIGLTFFYLVSDSGFLILLILLVAATGIISRTFTEKIHWFWMEVADFLGTVTSSVLLFVIFFILLFPVSLLAKYFRKKDLLQLQKKSSGSYFIDRNHLYTADDLNNPW